MQSPQRTFKKSAILLALLTSLLSGNQSAGLEPSSGKFATLNEALTAIAKRYNVLAGLELAINDTGQTALTVDLSGSDVAHVFDNIVAQRPAYAWRIEDGVYNLYPKTETEKISDLIIRNYSVKDVTLEEASEAISKEPEFQRWLSEKNLRRREFQMGSRNLSQRISVTLKGIPLHTILNSLIKEFGIKQWYVVRYGDRMEFIALYFYSD